MRKNRSASTSKALAPANISAQSPTSSSPSPDGNPHPLLAQAAAPASTLIDKEFWQNDGDKKIMALLALYKCLLDNTFSPDARVLSQLAARKMLIPYLGEVEATKIIYDIIGKIPRKGSMMDCLF